ncbi:MAG: hypothetical protein ABFS16_05255 [Bacteroidota bacterium]
MGNKSKSKKRDFVVQMITLLEQNTQRLTDKGYNPENKINELKTEITAADEA